MQTRGEPHLVEMLHLWLIRLLFEDLSRAGVLVATIALVGLRVMVWGVLLHQAGWRMKM